MRVLVVDDESCIRELIRGTRALKGYEVIEAKNGLEALESARLSPCDLVITGDAWHVGSGSDCALQGYLDPNFTSKALMA